MTNRIFRNLVVVLLLFGTACGLEAMVEQRDSIKSQSPPHWVTIEGDAEERFCTSGTQRE